MEHFEARTTGSTEGGRRVGGGRAADDRGSSGGGRAARAPAFAPVRGISLDRYAEVSAALSRREPPDPDRDAWLIAQGIPVGAWDEIHAEWRRRMTWSAQVRNRFEVLFSRF